MCCRQWQQDSNKKSKGPIPDVHLPLHCTVYVELVTPPLCFGELEMMRIGGGACGCEGGGTWCGNCGRTRTMTAKAMTETRMCRLSAESFETLRALYPQHMGNNRNFALRKADKKDPQFKFNLKLTRRRKHTMAMMQSDPGRVPSQMMASVDSLDERAITSFGTATSAVSTTTTDSDTKGNQPSASSKTTAGIAVAAGLSASRSQTIDAQSLKFELATFKEEVRRGQREIKEMLSHLIEAQHGASTSSRAK